MGCPHGETEIPKMAAKNINGHILGPKIHRMIILVLKNVFTNTTTPEYGGFNTEMSRNQGQSLKRGTKAVYTPLIDMVPSDPDTMMTAMVEAQRLTKLSYWPILHSFHK